MNTRELTKAIAERSYGLTQDQVGEVLSLFTEVVSEELAQPNAYIYIGNFGRLHIDYHELHPGGMLNKQYRQGSKLHRIYFRWMPTATLKEEIRRALTNTEDIP